MTPRDVDPADAHCRAQTFDDFFPRYCSEHRRPLTRWMHFAGTHAAGALVAAALIRRRPLLLLAAPVAAYGTAWLGHALVEGNRPATFRHPLWSFRGDLRMLGMMWAARDAEIVALADRATTARPIVLPAPGSSSAA